MDGCTSGKKCMDKKGAITLRNAVMESQHIAMREYWCGWCGTWHLSTLVVKKFAEKIHGKFRHKNKRNR